MKERFLLPYRDPDPREARRRAGSPELLALAQEIAERGGRAAPFPMDLGLTGKAAAVAAASRGLGRAAAHALAAEGCAVALCGRDEARVREAAEAIARETGARTLAVKADVGVAADCRGFVTQAAEAFGRLDILVTNTGGPKPGGFEAVGDEEWEEAYRVTLANVVHLVRAAIAAHARAALGPDREHRLPVRPAAHRGPRAVEHVPPRDRRPRQDPGQRAGQGRHPREHGLPRLHAHGAPRRGGRGARARRASRRRRSSRPWAAPRRWAAWPSRRSWRPWSRSCAPSAPPTSPGPRSRWTAAPRGGCCELDAAARAPARGSPRRVRPRRRRRPRAAAARGRAPRADRVPGEGGRRRRQASHLHRGHGRREARRPARLLRRRRGRGHHLRARRRGRRRCSCRGWITISCAPTSSRSSATATSRSCISSSTSSGS